MGPLDVEGCLACDLTAGREQLPGGLIHSTAHWRVEHCVGPLGIGTLLVKPTRHVVRVAHLVPAEAAELGALLADTAQVVDQLTGAEQTYACLWSHAGREPGHIHFVVQPAVTAAIDSHDGRYGPALQLAMLNAGIEPDPTAVEAFADRARTEFSARAVLS